jgi:phosphocarrier protein
MPTRSVIILNKLGLHARAAAKFVTLASSFESEVHLSRNSQTINGKSIMGVMMLAASKGTELKLSVEGQDAQNALERLSELIAQRFGEDE